MKRPETNYLSRITEQYDKLLLDLLNEELKIAKNCNKTLKLSTIHALKTTMNYKKI